METVSAFLESLYYDYSDFGLLALRLALAAIFLTHGIQKWKMWKMQPSEHMSGSMLGMMRTLSIVEPLAGLAVLLGFFTEIGAALLGIVMLGALYFKIAVWKKKFTEPGGWELDLLILAAAIALALFGSGDYGIDTVLRFNLAG